MKTGSSHVEAGRSPSGNPSINLNLFDERLSTSSAASVTTGTPCRERFRGTMAPANAWPESRRPLRVWPVRLWPVRIRSASTATDSDATRSTAAW